MPSWFEDHLSCAPLGDWLPELLAGGGAWVELRTPPPGALSRLLAAVPPPAADAITMLAHVGPLHVRPAVAHKLEDRGIEVVVDVAWIAAAAGWITLRPWRRGPMRRDAADRMAWLGGLGLVEPQQWMCTDPLPVIVTMGRRR